MGGAEGWEVKKRGCVVSTAFSLTSPFRFQNVKPAAKTMPTDNPDHKSVTTWEHALERVRDAAASLRVKKKDPSAAAKTEASAAKAAASASAALAADAAGDAAKAVGGAARDAVEKADAAARGAVGRAAEKVGEKADAVRASMEPATPAKAESRVAAAWGKAKRALGGALGGGGKKGGAPTLAPPRLPPNTTTGVIPSNTAALVTSEGDAAAAREARAMEGESALEAAEAAWGDEAEAMGGLGDVRDAVVGAGTHASYKR